MAIPRRFENSAIRHDEADLVYDQTHYSAEYFLGVLQAFVTVQAQRLAQARQNLPRRGQLLLDALPLLVHGNLSGIAGLSVADAPAGIVGFTPSKTQTAAWRQLTHLPFSNITPTHEEIHALFLMGSAGSVAQTTRSDLDLWVCVTPSAQDAMRAKLDRIEQFAARQGVEIQAFTVVPGQFARARQSQSSALLLDEFYRSACWLAGAYPSWWLVPAAIRNDDYPEFGRQLHSSGLLRTKYWLDFGSCDPLSTSDIVTAMTRELQSARTDPYKALLKLGLLESYAAGSKPLATVYKEQVLAGGQTDAYLLLADRLDTFSADPQYRDMLRKAWIVKTSRNNARLATNHSWQAQITAWGWQAPDVEHLRWPERWSVREYLQEDEQLAAAYQHIWANIQTLIERDAPPLTTQTALQLARLRRDFAQDRGMLKAPAAQQARVVLQTDGNHWRLLEDRHQLASGATALAMISWLVRRGFSESVVTSDALSRDEMRQLFTALSSSGELYLLTAADSAGSNDDREVHIAQHSDPLCYGQERRCLIAGCEYVSADRELVETRPLTRAITDAIVRHCPLLVAGRLQRLRVKRRIDQLIIEARQALSRGEGEFVYPLGDGFIVLSAAQGEITSHTVTHLNQALSMNAGLAASNASRA